MSSNEKQPAGNPAAQGQQGYIPPPPPGPPPAETTQGQTPKHSNDTPLPDYDVPVYDPANPQFAPPPAAVDDDIYGSSPPKEHKEHASKWGFHGRHSRHGSDGEGRKKSNRLSALGEAFSSKVSGPVNALANKFGSEGFLPESLDKECEKAARILRAFCRDGIYTDAISAPPDANQPATSPSSKHAKKKSRVLLTIPSKVIARAQGLAIFTAVRLGFQATGSSGSGVLLARLPDGTWSPPSAIQITSIGAGFVAGVDIYDCVIVINTREALDLFTRMRMSLGSDLAVTAGPFGVGGALDWGVPSPSARDGKDKPADAPLPAPATATATTPAPGPGAEPAASPLSADNTRFQTPPVPEHLQGMNSDDDAEPPRSPGKSAKTKKPRAKPNLKPVYSYVKSRGLYAGVQIDGTVIAAREGANARFYGQALPVDRILAGDVPAQGPDPAAGTAATWPAGARVLYDVLRGAEGAHGPQGVTASASAGAGAAAGAGSGTGAAPTAGTGTSAGLTPTAAHGGLSPAFGAPPGTGGAPQSIWVPPPPPPGPPPAGQTQGGGDVSGVTAGVRGLDVSDAKPGDAAAPGPSTAAGASGAQVPPPAGSAGGKAAEAAAEAARAEPLSPPPPSYSESHGAGAGEGGEDLPPAYVEDGRHWGARDSKTGQH